MKHHLLIGLLTASLTGCAGMGAGSQYTQGKDAHNDGSGHR